MRGNRPGRGGASADGGDRRGNRDDRRANDAPGSDRRGEARGPAGGGFRADQRGGFRTDVRGNEARGGRDDSRGSSRDGGRDDARGSSRDGGSRDGRGGARNDRGSRGLEDSRGIRAAREGGSRVNQHEHETHDDERPKPPRINGPGERVVYGAGPVKELLARNAKGVRAIWVDPRRADKSVGDPVAQSITAARQANILVDDRDRDHLDRAAEGGRHQGIVAWLGPFEYAQLDDLIRTDEPPMLLALDGVEDPRNLGAILRSAYLLGAHGVIIPEHRAALVTPLVAKTSAGASELLPIALVPNLVRALEELREKNIWRVAVHATPEAKPIASIDGKMAHVLVLGSEGSGVRPLVAKNCDFHAIIPMQAEGVGSFNVSVAAALALYELRRQRA
ncbi:MAG: 23S rRNA (guanosine(2251)-2'-O)-methyltransferase RlmB [Kofleriaceae bacterium]